MEQKEKFATKWHNYSSVVFLSKWNAFWIRFWWFYAMEKACTCVGRQKKLNSFMYSVLSFNLLFPLSPFQSFLNYRCFHFKGLLPHLNFTFCKFSKLHIWIWTIIGFEINFGHFLFWFRMIFVYQYWSANRIEISYMKAS